MSRPEGDFPRSTIWWVRALRFANALDDDFNELSPTKINLWAANLTAICGAAATVVNFFGGHLAEVQNMWAGMVGWLAQAHTAHHFDKRLRRDEPSRSEPPSDSH